MLEEDDEIGDGESIDNGIDTLIQDLEGAVESRDRDGRFSSNEVNTIQERTPRVSNNRVFGSLKTMDAPKELYDATALLLQSSLLDEDTAMLLTKDIMDLSGNGEPDIHAINNMPNHEALNATTVDKNITFDNDSIVETTHNTEASALLATSAENEGMLKPSIFTMHSSTVTEVKDTWV